jgi:hypothetical protein
MKNFYKLLVIVPAAAGIFFYSAVSAADGCVKLAADLGYRSSNSSVLTLQIFLHSRNYLVADPTGFFGRMTEAAVKNFQKDQSLPQTGYFGPKSRAKLAEITCTPQVQLNSPANSTSSPQGGLPPAPPAPPSSVNSGNGGAAASTGAAPAVSAAKDAYLRIKNEFDAAQTFDQYLAAARKNMSSSRMGDIAAIADQIRDLSAADKAEMLGSIIKDVIPRAADFTKLDDAPSTVSDTFIAYTPSYKGIITMVFESGSWKLKNEKWVSGSDSVEPIPANE